jgi:hypothetical protein
MAEPTLNHHVSLALTADAENVVVSVISLFAIFENYTTGRRLNRISWLVRQIEVMLVLVLHKLHVLIQNMKWSVNFTEKLFFFSHPILMPFLLFLKID